MKLILLSICWISIIAVGSASCGNHSLAQQRQPDGRPITDHQGLIGNLHATGVRVEPEGEVDQPFFSVQGKMIKVYGEDVQVFEYPNAAAANAQAALVSSDGSRVGRSKIHWVGPPHFFKGEKLLVLYIGDNDQVIKALEALLGRQFAGK